jgi:hypothetical protein
VSPAASEDRGLASLRSPDDDPEPGPSSRCRSLEEVLGRSTVETRTAGVGRTGRYLHFWPAASGRPAGTRISLVAVGFIAPIAGWLVDRRDPGVAPQATQVTSNVYDQGSGVRRVHFHLRARSLPGSRLSRCGRGEHVASQLTPGERCRGRGGTTSRSPSC